MLVYVIRKVHQSSSAKCQGYTGTIQEEIARTLWRTTLIRISTWNQWFSWIEGRWHPVLSRVDRCCKVGCRIGLSQHIVGNVNNISTYGVATNWPSRAGYLHVWVSKTSSKEEDSIRRGATKYWWAQIIEVWLVWILSRHKISDSVGLSRTLGELNVHPLFF